MVSFDDYVGFPPDLIQKTFIRMWIFKLRLSIGCLWRFTRCDDVVQLSSEFPARDQNTIHSLGSVYWERSEYLVRVKGSQPLAYRSLVWLKYLCCSMRGCSPIPILFNFLLHAWLHTFRLVVLYKKCNTFVVSYNLVRTRDNWQHGSDLKIYTSDLDIKYVTQTWLRVKRQFWLSTLWTQL